MSNSAIRQQLIAQRARLDPAIRASAETQVCEQLAQLTSSSGFERIAVYHSIKHELSLQHYIDWLQQHSCDVCLPVIDQPQPGLMQFRQFNPKLPLRSGRFGLLEPSQHAPLVDPTTLQLVCVPMLGFWHRSRIGWGKGYYDTCFSFRRHTNPPPLLVGVGFSVQQHSGIVAQPWDVAMDLIITEKP